MHGLKLKEGECFDISAGERVFLTKNLAEEILRPLSSGKYTKIRFGNKSFGREAAQVAARVLSEVKSGLRDVDLSDIVAGRPETEALEVMHMLSEALQGSRLRYLNLSDNALGEKGIRAFSALLKTQHGLEQLSFMNNGISKEAAKAICECLPTGSRLKLLHFHNNMTGDEGAVFLSGLVREAAHLEDFRCSSTRVGEDGAVALAEALGAGSKLRVLDLRDNMFEARGGISLGEALRMHSLLTHVYLSDLCLGDEGSTAIFTSLESSAPNLRVLEVGSNEITHFAAESMYGLIRASKFLSRLVLSENELGDRGAVIISRAVKSGCEHLEELDFSSNSLTRVGAVTAAEAVSLKGVFKLLNIDGNRVSAFGVDEVRSIFKKGTVGTSALGPLDDNDVEGSEEEPDEENEGEEEELERGLQGLTI